MNDYNVVSSLGDTSSQILFEVNNFLPSLLLAIIVLIIGWIVGGIIGRIVRRVLTTIKLDEALDKAGVDNLSDKAGVGFKPAQFAGALVKWFVILVFLVVALDILNLHMVTSFMSDVVLGYLPNVFAAVFILFAAMIIAGLTQKMVEATLRAAGSHKTELFGKMAHHLIVLFGILAVLNQLQIADELVETLFMGIVFALSLALGLAFGLGGKDAAARYIDRISN